MRAIALTLALSMVQLSGAALADVPGLINYQGILTDPGGVAIDTTISMTFTIYDDSTGGSTKWTETQPSVQVSAGIYSVLLGGVNSIPDTVFDDPSRWLGVQVGGDAELIPRRRLASVAYAFRSADSGTDGDWTISGNHIYSAVPGSVGIGTVSPQNKLHVNGSIQATSKVGVGINPDTWDVDALIVSGGNSAPMASMEIRNADTNALYRLHNNSTKSLNFVDVDAGQSRISISSDGDVGIGTESPAEKLDVAGTVQMTGFKLPTGAADGHVLTSDSTGMGGWQPAAADDGDWTISGSDLYRASGRVGIGTASPGVKLDVLSPDPGVPAYLRLKATQGNAEIQLNAHNASNAIARVVFADNDVNLWGIGIPLTGTNRDFRIYDWDAGNTRVAVDATTGNVGIGTTSPAERLDVAGTARMSGFKMPSGAYDGYVLTSDAFGTGTWQVPAAAGTSSAGGWTDDGTMVRLTTSGDKVGIGTSTPGFKLEVEGVASTTGGRLVKFYQTATNSASQRSTLELRNDGTGAQGEYNIIAKNNLNSTTFYVSQYGGGYFNGSVGIGTQYPAKKVHVYSSEDTLVKVESSDLNAYMVFEDTGGSIYVGNTNGDFIVNSPGYWNQLVFTGAGDLGVGTSLPSEKLHVYDASGTAYIKIDAASGYAAGIRLSEAGSLKGSIYNYPTDDRMVFNNGGERMTIETNGNVGIGTSNPARTLHISDVMRLEPRATAPSSPSPGDMYIDSSDSNKLKVWDGTMWQACW